MTATAAGRLRAAAIAAGLVAALVVPVTIASGSGPVDPTAGPYLSLLGSMHEHSGYSDGWVGSEPSTFFASGKRFGLDFMGGSDHSDTFQVPLLSTSQYCLDPTTTPSCVATDDLNADARAARKWESTGDQALQATTPTFTGFRGFEWTSDVFGHINVYFSKNYANAKGDGGYATPTALYDWMTRRPEVGGGSDGLATFNHPGAKDSPAAPQPGDLNWHDFAYDARIDDHMVGIEVYNDTDEYDLHGPSAPAEGYYAHALDKGWHLGPIGAEDLGHRRSDDWGGPGWAKTVILSTDRSAAALRSAMLARRFYAVRHGDVRLDYTVDSAVMGSRLQRAAGAPLHVKASASWGSRTGLQLQLVTRKGAVVETGTDSLDLTRAASTTEPYYFLRVLADGNAIGFSAPIWVSAAAPATHVGEWLAGDLHVHSCYSHDVYCPRGDNGRPTGDYNTDESEAYTLGGDPSERFLEASARGMDYLALTDHHSDGAPNESGALSWKDPGFGTDGVIGVPGHENSIGGHAQMLGALHAYPRNGDDSAAGINAMADRLRADGGVFQANHPSSGLGAAMTACSDTKRLHWSYGYDVKVDSMEVWNEPEFVQAPLPGTENEDSIFYWQCMLDRGWHVTATGGSDSHWLSTISVQGIGNPTTWVLSTERSARGVLDAIKSGRTAIAAVPPSSGGAPLLLEADRDRDGVYESMVGDTVPPSTPLRVRSESPIAAGVVELHTNSGVQTANLTPGGTVEFAAPAKPGWAWSRLLEPDGVDVRRAICDPQVGDQTAYCRQPLLQVAMTSALYLAVPEVTPTATPVACPTKKNGKDEKGCETAAPALGADQAAGTAPAGRSVGRPALQPMAAVAGPGVNRAPWVLGFVVVGVLALTALLAGRRPRRHRG
ncbi:MAG: hypothetical protein QOJ92_694 [Frankiales bacterium]|nr:hypothetical protein [Frankiales bacterium]